MRSLTRGGMKWVSILGALALVCLGTGCDDSECTNSFDCQDTPERSDPENPYVCRDNLCVPLRDNRPTRDAGTETDGGTDGGTVSCDTTPHDAKLGTLELQDGFEATETAEVPAGIISVTALGPGPTYTLYGVSSSDKSLHALGTWPSLSLGADALFPVLTPEDREASAFLGTSLVNDGTRLLTGYTKSGQDFPGSVALYDTATPAKSGYFSAPGNYTLGAIPGVFFVNGLGLADVSNGGAIYALKVGDDGSTASTLATFDAAWKASSGLSAVTEDGVAVFGYFDGVSFINRMRAAPPSLYTPALTSGTAFELSQATELSVGSDLFGAASFGGGVALLRGNYDATFTPVYIDVTRVALTLSGDTVTVGDPAAVLKFTDTCTAVEQLVPLGGDLLVGVSDKNGRRLVRLHLP